MTVKIAISLPDDAVEHLRRKVQVGEATSVSAAVAGLVEADKQQETWAEFLDDLRTAHGSPPPTEEELAEMGRELGLE